MDDLMAHFSNVSADELHPKTALDAPFNLSTASINTSSHTSLPPPLNIVPNGNERHDPTPSAFVNSANPSEVTQFLHPLDDGEPLAHAAISRHGAPYSGVGESTSIAPTPQSEEEKLAYIHHFKSTAPIKEDPKAAPKPRRNLLSELADVSNENINPAERTASTNNGVFSTDMLPPHIYKEMAYKEMAGKGYMMDEEDRGIMEQYKELEFHRQVLKSHESGAQTLTAENGIKANGVGHNGHTSSASTSTTGIDKVLDLDELLRHWHKRDKERDAIVRDLCEEVQHLRKTLQERTMTDPNGVTRTSQDTPLTPKSAGPNTSSASLNEDTTSFDAVRQWQQTAATHFPRSSSPIKGSSELIYLNVNGQRVDPPFQKEVDDHIQKQMYAQMKTTPYCTFFHLLDSCSSKYTGKPCKYRHGPDLSKEERQVLKNHARRLPCNIGSSCRNPQCVSHYCLFSTDALRLNSKRFSAIVARMDNRAILGQDAI
ncbi:hypothetical protein ACLMJK_007661 [Lecanora helva]